MEIFRFSNRGLGKINLIKIIPVSEKFIATALDIDLLAHINDVDFTKIETTFETYGVRILSKSGYHE